MAALAQAAAALWPAVRDVVTVTAVVNMGCAVAAVLTRRALRLWHGDPGTGQHALMATSTNPVQGRFHVLAPDSDSDSSSSDSDSDSGHGVGQLYTPTWVLAATEYASSTSVSGSDNDAMSDSDGDGDGDDGHDDGGDAGDAGDGHGAHTETDSETEQDEADGVQDDDEDEDDDDDDDDDEDDEDEDDDDEDDEEDDNEAVIAEHLYNRRYEYYIAYESSSGRRGHMPVPLSVTRIQLGPHPDPCKDMTCSVCMENFATGEYLVVLQCSHILHANCFATMWLQRHRTCPMCRAAIPNVPPP